MKIGFDKQKSAEVLSSLAQKSLDITKNVSEGVKSGVGTAVEKGKAGIGAVVEKGRNDLSAAIEKSKNDNYEKRLKKLNPLFPEVYKSEQFSVPNMIIIVDDAVRRGIDVCEGSIGWLETRKDMEVLCLYDEAVEFSGLQFVPYAACDAIYYVDNFDRNKYIQVETIFSKAHGERLAELQHVAYCVGAKRCYIELVENKSVSEAKSARHSAKVGSSGVSAGESHEHSSASTEGEIRNGRVMTEFMGERQPQRPNLKWFAHDETILNFVEMCCSGQNYVKTNTLELSGSTHATVSLKAATAIDAAIGTAKAAGASSSMEANAISEHNSKLIFEIEF